MQVPTRHITSSSEAYVSHLPLVLAEAWMAMSKCGIECKWWRVCTPCAFPHMTMLTLNLDESLWVSGDKHQWVWMGGGISVACVHALAHVCMSCALYVHTHDRALVLYVKVGTFMSVFTTQFRSVRVSGGVCAYECIDQKKRYSMSMCVLNLLRYAQSYIDHGYKLHHTFTGHSSLD